jgi:catechol 2,3-dioxygenase-like lactoylglutathione lyase family enzyme
MRKAVLFVIAMTFVVSHGITRGLGPNLARSQTTAASPLPMPTFHHIHINSVNPERSLEWYSQYWPKGKRTTFAGFPAFYDDIYLLFTKVNKQAPGAFDRKLERSLPQSAFWTFGSTFEGPDTKAVRERLGRLDPKQFQFVTLYGGPEGKQTALHALDLPMGDQLLTGTAIKQRSEQEKQKPRPAPTSGLDFAYVVDADGTLVEITAGKTDSFRGHTHFWGERPLCTSNWHVEHLGAQFPPTPNTFNTGLTFRGGKWDPCDVPAGEVTYPTYMRQGQLRIPAGNARIANAGWLWYPRQCRAGRCGPGTDQPLARSRGQVVDHIGLTYPDLDAVIAHLKTKKVPILEGPYKLADTRAILIEDVDGLAFELIEAKK